MGFYTTLMKMIIFVRVCFKLSQKTVPLTKSLFSGSVWSSEQKDVFEIRVGKRYVSIAT
jgi:hypothetical protein